MTKEDKNIVPERYPKDMEGQEPVPEEPRRILVGGIWLDIIEMEEGDKPFKIDSDGHITLGRKRFEEERKKIKDALGQAIQDGNRTMFDKMTEGLAVAEDEEFIDLYINLQKLFRDKSSEKLDSINVDLLTDGIAQRNIIREGLKPQMEMLPFIFKDKNGRKLDLERDVDLVFIKTRRGYGIIAGSKKGIDEIEIPEKLGPHQFQPDLLNIEKDKATGTIIIPLKSTKNNSESYANTIEIIKEPIDLPRRVALEEAGEQAKKARKKKEGYNPPPARPPRRSSESGGYGYVRVSG